MTQTQENENYALKIIETQFDASGKKNGFGAVLARAGVGKTSFLVQLALAYMMKEKNVLHISLDDPVKKVTLRYKEAFRLQKEQHKLPAELKTITWEQLIAHRFIMTFKVEGFNVPKLEERLTDLTEQDIFKPDTIIVDGLPFDDEGKKILSDLTELSEKHTIPMWFTATTHRHEDVGENGMPIQMNHISELFNLIILLNPEKEKININVLKKPENAADDMGLYLNTSTLLICSKNDQ